MDEPIPKKNLALDHDMTNMAIDSLARQESAVIPCRSILQQGGGYRFPTILTALPSRRGSDVRPMLSVARVSSLACHTSDIGLPLGRAFEIWHDLFLRAMVYANRI